MLENKMFDGNHYSRIIASWVNGGGASKYGYGRYFKEWLRTLEFVHGPMKYELVDGKWVCVNEDELVIKKLPEDVIKEIVDLATIGICEFEGWTETWIAQNSERIEKDREERRKKYKTK